MDSKKLTVSSIFLSVGLLHLDEVVIGIGHRAVPRMDI